MQKLIKLDSPKLDDLLNQVQAKTRERNITNDDIQSCIDRLNEAIPCNKKHLEGTIVRCNTHSQEFPKSYKYVPESTHVVLEYKNGWKVLDIYRSDARSPYFNINFSELTKSAIIYNLENRMGWSSIYVPNKGPVLLG